METKEAKLGLWWGLQHLTEGEMVDLCNMPSSHRVIIKGSDYIIASQLPTARRVNTERFNGKAEILSREQALDKYPNFFFKSSDAYKEIDKKYRRQVGLWFNFRPDIAEYVRTKKNKTAYVTKLIEMEREGIIKVD